MIEDLKKFIEYLMSKGRVVEIEEEVDSNLEVTAFTDETCKEKSNKTLFFKNIKGYDIPVVTNLFASKLTLSELFDKNYAIELLNSLNNINMNIKKLSLLKSVKLLNSFEPKIIENKKDYRKYIKLENLDKLPILKVWPKDAGKFITQPLVITQSPIDNSLNIGIYRMQVYDKLTTGMHWQSLKGGAIHASEAKDKNVNINTSVVIGTDPYNILSAIAPLPHGFNEFSFSGLMRDSKTLLMKNGKYPPVPLNSEIIINGYVNPKELRIEGPFGDHTGYYSIREEYPVFHVEEIYTKDKPIYSASIVGWPRNEDANIGLFFVDIFKPLLKALDNSIVDIYMPPEGNFTNTCFVSIKKRFPGQAKKIMFSILGSSQLSFSKIIIVFDDDIDIKDLSSVMWALSTRIDPQRDITIIPNTFTDSLDHTTNLPSFGSKILIDATKKTRDEGYYREWPDIISLPDELVKKVEEKWKSLKK
ncbi:MAG: UbiD family decarboxylase [Candidatus Marsarchaeota archaeon]|nr:UbiD family decarboxylase [Candidatus Marsarchaeota archaeon]